MLASPLIFEPDSVCRRGKWFCLLIKLKASKAEADLEDAVRAESVTVAGDGDQLADLSRQRCKLVRGLVASVAQFERHFGSSCLSCKLAFSAFTKIGYSAFAIPFTSLT